VITATRDHGTDPITGREGIILVLIYVISKPTTGTILAKDEKHAHNFVEDPNITESETLVREVTSVSGNGTGDRT
jgi:hypothetical protein